MAASDWYTPSGWPSTGQAGTSSPARAELLLIKTGISEKLPDLVGNGGKIVVINTGATGLDELAAGATTEILVGGGAGAVPVWTTATGSGAPVRATSPTLVTPNLGTPSALVLTNASGTPGSIGLANGTGLPIDGGTTGTLPASRGGTGVTSSTGSGNVVLSTSPTLVTPNLGTPSTLVGTNISGTGANYTAGQATAALGLKSASTTVSISAATAPSAGQGLIASSSTLATWQDVATSLDTLSAMAASKTINNAAHNLVWNWDLTAASEKAFTISESGASSGGSGSQDLLFISTLTNSTANPLRVQAEGVDILTVGRFGTFTVTTSDAQDLTLSSGAGTLSNGSGDVTLSSGNATGVASESGNVTISTGTSGSDVSGDINFQIGVGSSANGKLNFVNCNVANAAVATTLGSVGPTGASTTVQGWLAIKVGGVARFIPFW